MARIDLKALRDADLRTKGPQFDSEASQLVAYAEDSQRSISIATLRQLGMGLPQEDCPYPPDISLLRYVIEQIAVGYSRPPTRWLIAPASGERIDSESQEAKLVSSTLAASAYDGALQVADEMRALLRQAVVRIYPIDALGRCDLRIFGPHQVMRSPSSEAPAHLDLDKQFALRLSNDELEVWTRDEQGWSFVWTDSNGKIIEDFGYVPHALPVLILPDRHVSGRAWLPLASSRLGLLKALTAASSEVMAMLRSQGHSREIYSGVMTSEMPKEIGPSVAHVFQNPDAKAMMLNPQPQIAATLESIRLNLEHFLFAENLPVDLLSSTRAIQTGAALQVQLSGLIRRQQKHQQIANWFEPLLYARFRDVHNVYASSWGVESLPELDIEAQLAPISVPTAKTEQLEVASRKLAIGLASRVDVLMEVDSISRDEATKRLKQIDADNRDYPALVQPDAQAAMQAGPRTASAPDVVLDTPDATSASVVDTIQQNAAIAAKE